MTHFGTPLLIVAGAGSGKTRVLTNRIAYLLAAREVHPGEIIAITFTNKAAGEMKERVAALVGNRARLMWVSTFHSACVRILRAEHEHAGLKSTFSIYDADDSRRLMQLVARELDLDPKRHPARKLAAQVSNLKNELVDAETARPRRRARTQRTVAEAYVLYQRRLREAQALDFDDLIMGTVHLFQAHPEVAEHYRRRFRHVLVDEYQDTNHAQYALVKELVGTGVGEPATGELCVVGDADQSIYAFRGATIRNILEFERDYPDARTILLEQNYRSTQTILDRGQRGDQPQHRAQAQEPVERPGRRASRSSATSPTPSTPRPTGSPARSTGSATRGVARPGDVAVFYRTNAQSRVFEEIFIRLGLPYKVVGGVRFYERKEVRDALAYLRAIANPDDTVSVRRVLNTPRRGIGDRAVGVRGGAVDPRADLLRRRAAPGRRRRPACRRGPRQRDRRLRRAARRAARDERGRAARRRCWRPCCAAPATSTSWSRAPTRRTRAGSTTCMELVSVAREYTERVETCDSRQAAEERRRTAGRRRPSPASSSRSRWSPTPTRSPPTTRTTPASSR